jgi:hypothetical protein
MAIKLALLSAVVAGALAAMAYNLSDQIAADMRPEAGEWRVLASMLDGLKVLAPDAQVVRAPRLAAGSMFTHTGLPDDRYWSDYLAARYGRAVEVKTDFVQEADLERGLVTLDFSLMSDGRSFAITLSRHRRSVPGNLQLGRVDAIAMRVERATDSILGMTMVVFRDHQGHLNQIPLANVPYAGDAGWRVLTGIDADPAPIHLQHPSMISRFMM